MRLIGFGLQLMALVLTAASLRPEGPAVWPRVDQAEAAVAARAARGKGADPSLFAPLIAISPGNAYYWSAQGLFLNELGGQAEAARRSVERASALAPAVAPIRMRHLNFCLGRGEAECVLEQGRAVLELTPRQDHGVFSSYRALGLSAEQIKGRGIPETPRAWRAWLEASARSEGAGETFWTAWQGLRERHGVETPVVERVVGALWERKEVEAAWRVWREYRQSWTPAEPEVELLSNGRFARAPARAPFDWRIAETPGVRFERGDGLRVQFLGRENLEFRNVGQSVAGGEGRYALAAVVSYEGLTTDEGPRLRVSGDGGWRAESGSVLGTGERRRVVLEFTAPPGTRVVRCEWVRARSARFDSKIAGILHIHEMSLRRQ